MTTVNSRQVNLRRPASPALYPLDEYIMDTEVIPIEVFDSLEEAKSFLIENRGGTISFPRRSMYNDYKYVVYMKGNPDSTGVVVNNIITYSDHYPQSNMDTRPVDGEEWLRGDIVCNTDCLKQYAPTSWVCIEQGMPGVWMARGYISANYNDVQVFEELPDANEQHLGQIVLHKVDNELSELCYCAEVADNVYEWKSILAYNVTNPPDEEDLYDKFLAYGLPLSAMSEFAKHDGPSPARMYDLKDRLVTAEDLVEYDRLQYKKTPSIIAESPYSLEVIIEPNGDMDNYTDGIWYCPYDFNTFNDDIRPINYPPTKHPVLLKSQQFLRITNNSEETIVLQKATDVMTGETYSRCGKMVEGKMTQQITNIDDVDLYKWHQNGNATPIADLSELFEIIERNMTEGS